MQFFVRLTGTLVRPTGIEPALREELDPKSSASANSATGAKISGTGCSRLLRMQSYYIFVKEKNKIGKKYVAASLKQLLHIQTNYFCPLPVEKKSGVVFATVFFLSISGK